jgi:predicted NAD-dependent protein-ADP-ribosyltransferase YbiA (DUF1768 family)
MAIMEAQTIWFSYQPSDRVLSEHLFLNLCYHAPFTLDSKAYATVLHYFESQKYMGTPSEDQIRVAATVAQAKTMAKDAEAESPRDHVEWHRVRGEVMLKGLRGKFGQNPELLGKLLTTGSSRLAEIGNHPYWSGSEPTQANKLGELLVTVREEFKSKMMVVPTASGQVEDFTHHSAKETKSFLQGIYEEAEGSTSSSHLQSALMHLVKRSLSTEKYDDHSKTVEKCLNLYAPFLFLTVEQKSALIEQASIVRVDSGYILTDPDNLENMDSFILATGKALATNKDHSINDILLPGASFGLEGSLFGVRAYSVTTLTESLVICIPPALLTSLIEPGSQFAQAVARNMITKQHLLDHLQNFKTFVLTQSRNGVIETKPVVKMYRKISSALHPHCESNNLDIDAWKYALFRLPENITSTYSYLFTDKFPDTLSHPEVALPIKSSGRARSIFQVMPGKSIVLLRELETDLLDFISNLCIHMVESRKLRHKISSPKNLHLLMSGGSVDELPLSEEEKEGVKSLWKTGCQTRLAEILLHHEDYKLLVEVQKPHVKQDPSERWITRVWEKCAECLDIPGISIGEAIARGLRADIIQGSTRTALACISPYMFMKEAEIRAWFRESGLTLKTKEFKSATDELIAQAYYYFLSHPEESEKRIQVEGEYGIVRMNETEFTGIRVVLINAKKLSKEFCDPAIRPESEFPLHLVVNIGYTFGSQAADIMRSLAFLFGPSMRSLNVIGKAGGLAGSRSDIVISSKFYNETTNEIISTNPAGLDPETLKTISGTNVRIGPMLTVTGTILQNAVLLKHYKYLLGCVALEMEGCYLAQELKKGQEAGFLPKDLASRFLYYISDLPLDPSSTLAMEDSVVSWDEGIGSLNAVARFIFQLIFEQKQMAASVALEIVTRLAAFTTVDARPIAVISSGGTSVPLEARTVRSVENFSTGRRGAASAEYFLKQGYRVLFLTRDTALKPYLRVTANAENLPIDKVGQIVQTAVQTYNDAIGNGSLLVISYKSVSQYLSLLEAAVNALIPVQSRVLFYMAAAVSDYFLPESHLSPHKISSEQASLDLHLLSVPKKLGLIKQLCPEAYVVSFKLETEGGRIEEAARKAIRKYGVDLVVGNELERRETECRLYTEKDEVRVEKGEGEIEEQLVQEILRKKAGSS